MKNWNYETIKQEFKNKEYEVINFFKKQGTLYIKYVCLKHQDKGELNIRYSAFRSGQGCRYCANEKKSKDKLLTHQEFLNKIKTRKDINDYEILENYTNARIKILVKHLKCNKEYKIFPSKFMAGCSCPYCQGRYRNEEEFKLQMYNLVQDEYKLISKFNKYGEKVEIKHEYCGYEYEVLPKKFLGGNRCPICSGNNSSNLSCKIESFLYNYNLNYKKEFSFKDLKNILPLRFDFAVFYEDKLYCLIEADGYQHFYDDGLFGKDLNETKRRDELKNEYCKNNNIHLIRIPYYQLKLIDNILEKELINIININNIKNKFVNIQKGLNLSKNTIFDIRKLYFEGKSMNNLSKIYNIQKYNIKKIICYDIFPEIGLEFKEKILNLFKTNKFGSAKKGKSEYIMNKQIKKDIINYYNNNKTSFRKMEKIFNVDRHIISNIIKDPN